MKLYDTFWDHVAITGDDACWPWTRAHANGYGWLVTDVNVRDYAHRVAYRLHHGHAPSGVVMHSCDNRECCNPAHLVDGTQADNMADMTAKGYGPLRTGQDNGAAILTDEQVRTIKRDLAAGYRQGELARRYGVTRGTVWHIAHGRTWTHV